MMYIFINQIDQSISKTSFFQNWSVWNFTIPIPSYFNSNHVYLSFIEKNIFFRLIFFIWQYEICCTTIEAVSYIEIFLTVTTTNDFYYYVLKMCICILRRQRLYLDGVMLHLINTEINLLYVRYIVTSVT